MCKTCLSATLFRRNPEATDLQSLLGPVYRPLPAFLVTGKWFDINVKVWMTTSFTEIRATVRAVLQLAAERTALIHMRVVRCWSQSSSWAALVQGPDSEMDSTIESAPAEARLRKLPTDTFLLRPTALHLTQKKLDVDYWRARRRKFHSAT